MSGGLSLGKDLLGSEANLLCFDDRYDRPVITKRVVRRARCRRELADS